MPRFPNLENMLRMMAARNGYHRGKDALNYRALLRAARKKVDESRETRERKKAWRYMLGEKMFSEYEKIGILVSPRYRGAKAVQTWRLSNSLTDQTRLLRRAAKDAAFRRTQIAKLRQEIRKLARSQNFAGMYGVIQWHSAAGTFHQNSIESRQALLSELLRLSSSRVADKALSVELQDLMVHLPKHALVPIGFSDVPLVELLGVKICRIGKEWKVAGCVSSPGAVQTRGGRTQWKGSRPVRYFRAQYTTYVRSFAVLHADGTLTYRLHNSDYPIPAPPAGYAWNIDAAGLRLLRLGSEDADYHVSCGELLHLDFDLLVQRINELEALRLRNDDRLKGKVIVMSEAELQRMIRHENVYVSWRDNELSGNCLVGTMNWIRSKCKRGLRRNHVRACTLLPFVRERRVNNVLRTALARHLQEMRTGSCLLEEHGGPRPQQ